MEILSGLHPRAVHFPIAFFVLYFVFETAGIFLKKDYLNKSALIILLFGILGSVIAVLTGNQAYEAIKTLNRVEQKTIIDAIDYHELSATIALWYFTALFFYRVFLSIKKKFYTNYKYLIIFFAFLGCVLIFLTGYTGGKLVFDYGIGTELFGN